MKDHALVGLVTGVIHTGLGDEARRAAQFHIQLRERVGRHAVGVGLPGHTQASSEQVEITCRFFPALARLADIKLREPDLTRAGGRRTEDTDPSPNHERCHFHGDKLSTTVRSARDETFVLAGFQ